MIYNVDTRKFKSDEGKFYELKIYFEQQFDLFSQ